MPKSGGDKQNDNNSEHNHSDFSPRNYLHILYHSLRLDQKEFRIATVAMFTCDLYAGVVPQMMSPLPHDLERLRTTMVDFIVIFNRGHSVVSWTLYG